MLKYKIIDMQGQGDMETYVFNSKEEIRQHLVNFHSFDCNRESLKKMSVEEICDFGEWDIEEIDIKTDLEEFKEVLLSVGYKEVEGDDRYSEKTFFVDVEDSGDCHYKLIWTTEPNEYNSYMHNKDFFVFFNDNEERISAIN